MNVIATIETSKLVLVGVVILCTVLAMSAPIWLPWWQSVGQPFKKGERVTWANSHGAMEEIYGPLPMFPLIFKVYTDTWGAWYVEIVLNEDDPKNEWRTSSFLAENFRVLRNDQLRYAKKLLAAKAAA